MRCSTQLYPLGAPPVQLGPRREGHQARGAPGLRTRLPAKPDPDAQPALTNRGLATTLAPLAGLLGIAREVVTAAALGAAAREARDPAEREHVMPFLHSRPERFRIGTLHTPADLAHHRYTVDTDADLAFARAIAARRPHGQPIRLAELEALARAEPTLTSMNSRVRQKSWREVDGRSRARRDWMPRARPSRRVGVSACIVESRFGSRQGYRRR